MVGRANLATVLFFSGDAAREEMGLTNRLIPAENDPNGILPPAISECDTVPDPEDGPDADEDRQAVEILWVNMRLCSTLLHGSDLSLL